MAAERPLILITNDDGFYSSGIKALANGVKSLGDVVVVAPDGPRSGMSSALSSINPLRVKQLKEEEGMKVYACTGTPVDCIKLAMNTILDRKPDLVVTGINHGSNSAIAVIYSGTMGSAMEGCLFGVPSVGFSLLNHAQDADFSTSEKVVEVIGRKVLEEGLPQGTCLNVNIPDGKEIKGVKICRQSKGKWEGEIIPSKDGFEQNVYWLGGSFSNHDPNAEDTDETALAQGYVSIVPVKVDMTDYECKAQLESWDNLI